MSEKYSGMTVNERLYLSGCIDDFDRAVREKKSMKVKSILKELEVDEISIKAILEKYKLES